MQAHFPLISGGPLLVLLLAPALVCAQPASAGPVPGTSAAAIQAPQLDEILVKEGYHTAEFLQRSGDLSGALTVLQMTYERVKTPFLLWPIAQLSSQLRQPLLGLRALGEYARRVPPQDMEPGRRLDDVTL